MNTKNIISLFLFSYCVLLLISCSDKQTKPNNIVQSEDLIGVLQVEEPRQNSPEKSILFWENKLKEQPNASPYMIKIAGLLADKFKREGNIEDLHRSDELLGRALKTYLIKKSGVYHALATNAITRHDFKAAKVYAQQAIDTKEKPEISSLYLFDAQLELGALTSAKQILKDYPYKNNFEYLIRLGKVQDADGDLDAAIYSMEKAFTGLDAKNNRTLYIWALSNLGDMYGHDGNIQKSYDSFLEVLSLDPNHYHSMKGIAWIAFSKDKNPSLAKKIMYQIGTENQLPDFHLLLAEIAGYEGDESAETYHTEAFLAEAEKENYEGMYNKYLFDIALQENDINHKALSIAMEEVKKRPTVQSYQLLARTYLKQGQTDKAIAIASEKIEGKSFEPEVIYHLGMIYQAAQQNDKALEYLKEAQTASYELGPNTSAQIQKKLQELATAQG